MEHFTHFGLLVTAGILFATSRWAYGYFGISCFGHFLFHRKAPTAGVGPRFLLDWFWKCLLIGGAMGALVSYGIKKYCLSLTLPYNVAEAMHSLKRGDVMTQLDMMTLLSQVVFWLVIVYFLFQSGVILYLINRARYSDLYEYNYVRPLTVAAAAVMATSMEQADQMDEPVDKETKKPDTVVSGIKKESESDIEKDPTIATEESATTSPSDSADVLPAAAVKDFVCSADPADFELEDDTLPAEEIKEEEKDTHPTDESKEEEKDTLPVDESKEEEKDTLPVDESKEEEKDTLPTEETSGGVSDEVQKDKDASVATESKTKTDDAELTEAKTENKSTSKEEERHEESLSSKIERTFENDSYVEDLTAIVKPPENKKNLIHIYLESMESAYLHVTKGGSTVHEDLLTNLTELAEANVSFSDSKGLGGGMCPMGTLWTTGGILAAEAGIPLLLPTGASYIDGETPFAPGAVTLGDILAEDGYLQEFLVGADASMGGRRSFYKNHGDFRIADIHHFMEQDRLSKEYDTRRGFDDDQLYTFAKEELTALYEECQKEHTHFHFTMLTADTHYPKHYKNESWPTKFRRSMTNRIHHADKLLGAFMTWLQEQPFYEDTVIVIHGDHISMARWYMRLEYGFTAPRRTYNCFIHAVPNIGTEDNKDEAVNPILKNRTFTTFDYFPTILAAMGYEIEGERLGLGTNLFSGYPTLTEPGYPGLARTNVPGYTPPDNPVEDRHLNLHKLNREIRKNSDYYSKVIMELGKYIYK